MSNLFVEMFDLRQDQEDPDVIDKDIRSNAKIIGTNLWVLIFAILIASVGLNVNSTAVIIGAMLISPLMGPIVGIGYGLGTNDISLVRSSLKGFYIFTFLSIVTSSLYFVMSPLDTAQSELLARTSPSLWDVMIAFFGGSAGIIASTRKHMSNVVPGVAIATALMPPLCTAGFGIAHGNWSFFAGALFLYVINSVFIAVATFMFSKIFHLPVRHYVDEKVNKRTNLIVGIVVVGVVAFSIYLSYNLVQNSRFNAVVSQLVETGYKDNKYILLGHEVLPQSQKVILTVGGENNPKQLKENFENQLKDHGFLKADVMVRYSGGNSVDLGSLKTELTQEVFNNMVTQVEDLSKQNSQLQSKVNESLKTKQQDAQLFAELSIQYPAITNLSITRGAEFSEESLQTQDSSNNPIEQSDKPAEKTLLLAVIKSKSKLSNDDKDRIESWFQERFKDKRVGMMFETD